MSSILGWPVNHADAEAPVDDQLTLARLGVLDEQIGARGESPIYVRFPLGTWPSAWLAVIGIMSRLVSRERTGVAGPAHTSLAQGALIPMMMHWSRAATPSRCLRDRHAEGQHASLAVRVWRRSLDPHHAAGARRRPPLMQEVFAELGAGARRHGERAARGAGRCRGGTTGARSSKRSSTAVPMTWLRNMWAHDIPAQQAVGLGAILSDEQARANGYVVDVDDPEAGRITVPGLPLTLDPPMEIRGPAPRDRRGDARDWSARPEPSPRDVRSGATRPLEGLKVLDFGNFLAGPLGPMLLADLGATVVKVEATTGDPMRWADWPFAGCQRGKRAVALDIKSPASRPVLESLIRWADVVHHNLRMPAARRLGLDADAVRADQPGRDLLPRQLVRTRGSSCGLARLRPVVPSVVRLGGDGRR